MGGTVGVLRELRIRNFAIVDRLDLEFPGGLVALTGETGAGKSIIVGALGLALGERAHPDQQRVPGEETAVEAVFTGPFPPAVTARLAAAGVTAGDELVVRRLLPPGGKSRAYVNDAAVSLATLEETGRDLVDIHGQHQHQSLLRAETHLDFLDGFAGLLGPREQYRAAFLRLEALRRERADLESREREKERRLEFLRFQEEELSRAGLRAGEEQELHAAREVLRNVGRLSAAAGEAEALVSSGESSAVGAVGAAARRLAEAAAIDGSLAPLVEALGGAQLALEEAARELQDYGSRLEADPERLQEVEDRLALIGRLRKKYGPDVEAMLAELDRVRGELDGLRAGEARLARLGAEIVAAAAEVGRLAGELSRVREASRERLERRMLGELAALAMGSSGFVVRLLREEDPRDGVAVGGVRWRADERGAERAEFLLSANPGVEPRPLARIASGGELSRVMLALKTVLAEVDRVPTLVFDEVDIGIGGRTARTVGERLRALGRSRQVLCVTHLAQIASLADVQYTIEKRSAAGRTRVRVRRLEEADRVAELARMVGGRTVTEASLRHAAELLRGES
jgi:DNA repair protein RecN (Recombination protein N)